MRLPEAGLSGQSQGSEFLAGDFVQKPAPQYVLKLAKFHKLNNNLLQYSLQTRQLLRIFMILCTSVAEASKMRLWT